MERDRNSEGDNPDRSELYERIPWEHLERQASERQWLYVGVAGAIALGVLAYSFVKNQPVQPTTEIGSVVTTALEPPQPLTESTPASGSSVSSPIVVAEADLYAVEPERLAAIASAHAEWFAVEYFSVDGSAVSSETLRRLLPASVPLPEAPEGTQVFVDWVGTRQVAQIGEAEYDVDILVRSLVSTETLGFARQPVRLLRVRVRFEDDGQPRVATPPVSVELPSASPIDFELAEVPQDMAFTVPPGAAIVGGIPSWDDGRWRLVVMIEGIDGVRRPQMLEVP